MVLRLQMERRLSRSRNQDEDLDSLLWPLDRASLVPSAELDLVSFSESSFSPFEASSKTDLEDEKEIGGYFVK
jgi:hypothetical protein